MYSLNINEPFELENGSKLDELAITYHTYGKLNADQNNVVWVCHALTGSSDVMEWWPGLFGRGKQFDPERHFIVCANVIGSCYGSSGPSKALSNRKPLLTEFPAITVKDMVKAHEVLRKHLNISKINVLIGASLGGQQALEWSISNTRIIERLVLIATNAKHSPYGIAFNESQRQALLSDTTFGTLNGGKHGLKVARSIALLSYRSYVGYLKTQEDTDDTKFSRFKASSYQKYQGAKLAKRFDAHSYYVLSNAMDSHNVARGRTRVEEVLACIEAKTLVIGISSDLLFPLNEQRFIANHIPKAEFTTIHSDFGHDGFLIETGQLSSLIDDFINNEFKNNKPTVFRDLVKKHELLTIVDTNTNRQKRIS
jgi:homoserine O-acetyltransferase